MKKETLKQWQERMHAQNKDRLPVECWVVGNKCFTVYERASSRFVVVLLERGKAERVLTQPESAYETLGGVYQAILLNLQCGGDK